MLAPSLPIFLCWVPWVKQHLGASSPGLCVLLLAFLCPAPHPVHLTWGATAAAQLSHCPWRRCGDMVMDACFLGAKGVYGRWLQLPTPVDKYPVTER